MEHPLLNTLSEISDYKSQLYQEIITLYLKDVLPIIKGKSFDEFMEYHIIKNYSKLVLTKIFLINGYLKIVDFFNNDIIYEETNKTYNKIKLNNTYNLIVTILDSPYLYFNMDNHIIDELFKNETLIKDLSETKNDSILYQEIIKDFIIDEEIIDINNNIRYLLCKLSNNNLIDYFNSEIFLTINSEIINDVNYYNCSILEDEISKTTYIIIL
jgi:hypothetical protein